MIFSDLLQLIGRYGYLVVFFGVMLESAGMPVSAWSGKYRSLRGPNFSAWHAWPASLESLHGRSEESSSRNVREARASKGSKIHAAKMTSEGKSESTRKVA
jgi:hypothetical protein